MENVQISSYIWTVGRFKKKKKVTIGKHVQNSFSSNLTGDRYQGTQACGFCPTVSAGSLILLHDLINNRGYPGPWAHWPGAL